MAEPRPRSAADATRANRPFRLDPRSLGCDEAGLQIGAGGRLLSSSSIAEEAGDDGDEPTGIPCAEGGDTPATCRPALSIAVTRQLATVVVTLEGPLERGTCPALAAVLWDLVVGQENLSVTVDAHDIAVSDLVLMAIFTALRLEAADRGATLAVLEPSSLPAPPAGDPAGTLLDFARARRSARRGMAEHPAGGARRTHRTTTGAQDDPMGT